MRAETETFTMRLETEEFENMMKEYPEIRAKLLEDATFRKQVKLVEDSL